MSAKTFTLAHVAALLKCPPLPPAKAATIITGVAALLDAGPGEISFLSSEHYHKQFAATAAAAVLVDKKVKLRPGARPAVLLVDDAELAIAEVLELFAPPVPRPPVGVDPAARVHATASIGDGAAVGPFVQIGAATRIGANTIIDGGVYLGDDVIIGEDCRIFPGVTIRERITVGNRVIIHANSVLGSDGFGYRWDGRKHAKVPQIGTIVIEDDVEIGSCVCIDRAKFGVTLVGRGAKIDNLVQIAHNVVIGPHCIIIAQVGVAGSAKLGAGVVLGGQTAVRDHINIGDGAMSAACSGIAEDVAAQSIVSGLPAFPHRQSLREQAALRRLPDLVVQVRKLQEQIEQLKAK